VRPQRWRGDASACINANGASYRRPAVFIMHIMINRWYRIYKEACLRVMPFGAPSGASFKALLPPSRLTALKIPLVSVPMKRRPLKRANNPIIHRMVATNSIRSHVHAKRLLKLCMGRR